MKKVLAAFAAFAAAVFGVFGGWHNFFAVVGAWLNHASSLATLLQFFGYPPYEVLSPKPKPTQTSAESPVASPPGAALPDGGSPDKVRAANTVYVSLVSADPLNLEGKFLLANVLKAKGYVPAPENQASIEFQLDLSAARANPWDSTAVGYLQIVQTAGAAVLSPIRLSRQIHVLANQPLNGESSAKDVAGPLIEGISEQIPPFR